MHSDDNFKENVGTNGQALAFSLNRQAKRIPASAFQRHIAQSLALPKTKVHPKQRLYLLLTLKNPPN